MPKKNDSTAATAAATAAAAAKKPRVLGPDTLIADVTDYALDLYARERARRIVEQPDSGKLPLWLTALSVLLPGGFLLWFVMTMAGSGGLSGSNAVLAAVLGGASLLVVIVALFMRASMVGQLSVERQKELMELDERIKQKFESLGSKCYGCGAAYKETFASGAKVCGTDLEKWLAGLRELNLDLEKTRPEGDAPAT
ncbi:MAG: hypothetical protein AB7S36_04560 [Planctomycetota bacterium]